jgi:hypothetical protein
VVKIPQDVASRMDEKLRELESIIDTLNEIVTQQDSKLGMMNERLRIKEREVTSLEQERDQLCSPVATLKLKVGISEVWCMCYPCCLEAFQIKLKKSNKLIVLTIILKMCLFHVVPKTSLRNP